MDFKLKTGDLTKTKTPCLILGVLDKRKLSEPAEIIDKASGGRISEVLRRGDFDGSAGTTLVLYDLPGVAAQRVLLVGCGKRKELTRAAYVKAIAGATKQLFAIRLNDALCTLPVLAPQDLDLYRSVRETVTTVMDQSYRYDQTKETKPAQKLKLKRFGIWLSSKEDAQAAQPALEHGVAIGQGVHLAKDLGNLPGNVCTPAYLAERAVALADEHEQLATEILDEAAMEELGMGSLLSVSRGSRQPAKLIVMKWNGGESGAKPVVLVGKGLTFDAGGISLKPASDMDEMKYDMCGGASVFGAMRAAAEMGLAMNLIGVVPASENLPDGEANKPGDIVTSMSGQTIEILNTDAEGRLILCDALTYVERFEPAVVIDMATLTGAVIVGLGRIPSGLFTKDDALAAEIDAAGQATGDRTWRLPLWDDYQEQLDSNFADMANIGGRDGGSITAACFLARYTKKYSWAHIDIAGTAWKKGKAKGSTGRPVPLLTEILLRRAGQIT